MSISMAICELEAGSASCRSLKTDLRKILLDSTAGFEDISEYDDIVTLDDAKTLFPDWGAFLKRNRISPDTDAIYMDKVRNDDDAVLLRPMSGRVNTGWVSTADMDEGRIMRAIANSKEENRLTGWDMLTFDEMNETCSSCPLSWDKGRGCIGSFGPDSSALPEMAAKYGCTVTASVPESAAVRRIYRPEDALKLIEEVSILENALPNEGKVYVRRYAGVLGRLKAVAEISVKEGCGFYFF